ncbi:DNA damage-binding protein 1a, partial [Neolecta irregularis DAH-3]
ISAAAARSLHALTNIAPVSDFCVHDSGSSKAVVTCSGGYSDGSIRVVRNGIAVEELGSVDLEGIQAVWDLHNGLLVLAFSSETRVLQSTNDELEMLPEFPGIPFNKQTIFAGTINSSLVHVTRDSVLVSRRESILAAWHPPAGLYISHADSNASVIIVATQSGSVIQFSPALQIIAEYSFSSEISCLALTPSAILLGLWTRPSIHIIPLDKSTPIAESLPSDSIPRSIAILADHLIVSLGDGKVYTFSIHANKLVGKKSLNIAQTPVKLHSIEMNGQPAIWASSDRSGIFTIQAGKITWSSTNISDSNFVSNFSGFKDSLVIVNNSGMIFATVENAQKIHVKSFPMDGLPRRIVFTGQVWVVGVVQLQVRGETGQEYQRTFVKILQDGLFNEIHSFELDQDENISCINWIKQKVFVGTGYTNPDEDESSKGRILLFEINSEQKLRLVGETGIQGTCYALEPVQNRIICAVNSFVRIVRDAG